jgi:hypothetical protein
MALYLPIEFRYIEAQRNKKKTIAVIIQGQGVLQGMGQNLVVQASIRPLFPRVVIRQYELRGFKSYIEVATNSKSFLLLFYE